MVFSSKARLRWDRRAPGEEGFYGKGHWAK